ncbi:hypothetical protein chiPu_0032922, partial [Chiloscyllium punctatum]|nr:hypothetical protein [Chiloscyllium punctatum]
MRNEFVRAGNDRPGGGRAKRAHGPACDRRGRNCCDAVADAARVKPVRPVP